MKDFSLYGSLNCLTQGVKTSTIKYIYAADVLIIKPWILLAWLVKEWNYIFVCDKTKELYIASIKNVTLDWDGEHM